MPLPTGLERAPQGESVPIYPWSVSATKRYNQEALRELRDKPPERLAEESLSAGGNTLKFTLIELMCHGNPRKAAETARAAADEHSEVKNLVEQWFGGDAGVVCMLLRDNLGSIAATAKDFRGPVTYIN